MLLSLELLARDGERAARARNWVGDRDIEGESAGLLLLEPGSPLPSSLDEAVPRARISNRILRGERLALFWESYDLSAGDTLVVSIGVTRERGGVLRRAAQSLRLAKSWTPVSLAWRESVAESRAIFPRSVELDLSSLGTGKYRIELTVTRIGGSTARAGRDIEILDAPRSGETGGR
jgi:hypothetical protein